MSYCRRSIHAYLIDVLSSDHFDYDDPSYYKLATGYGSCSTSLTFRIRFTGEAVGVYRHVFIDACGTVYAEPVSS